MESMEVEKGVILAVFNEDNRIMVLKRKKNWEGWELPKGHLEKDDYRETVLIELEEEAGIDPEHIESVIDIDHTAEWEYTQDGKDFKKEYKAFLIKVSDVERVDTSENPDDEHEHGFFLRPRHVEEMLEYDNNREVLEKALEQLD
jgi:8-oxo-dGTP pyrophosphatase MutT (NUDIX family)